MNSYDNVDENYDHDSFKLLVSYKPRAWGEEMRINSSTYSNPESSTHATNSVSQPEQN